MTILTEEQVLERLKVSGALLKGHFRLPTGEHTDHYVECARVLQYPWHATVLCQELADRYRDSQPDLVVGPALGGIIIAFEVGRILELPTIFTERKHGTMKLSRGFSIRPGQRVLIVEDEIISGRSIKEVTQIIKDRHGEVVGVAALIDRSNGLTKEFGCRVETLVTLEERKYSPEECPLCKEKIPVSRVGGRSL